jgi:HPr kinase/phosphorylase
VTVEKIHATCVAFGDAGVLIRGPSGAGKSDLALRLIDAGAILVSDDRTELTRDGDAIVATAPAALQGLLEVRGVGILELPHAASARIVLVVDLESETPPERLPRPAWCEYLECRVRLMAAEAFERSAATKVRIAAFAAAGQTDPATGATIRRRDEDRPTK